MNRQERLTEMSGVGSVFLGMTVGCAKCHNHKFDPILQADYYRLQAVFAGTEGKDSRSLRRGKGGVRGAKKAYEAAEPDREGDRRDRKAVSRTNKAERKAKLEPKVREALDIPKEKRNEEQKTLAKDAEERIDPLG